jgi:2-dehydropantoate 2-reductase
MHARPSSVPTRVVIVGAGAVGAHLACALRKDTPLLIIDRDERIRAAFTERGVEVTCPVKDGPGDPRAGLFRPGDIAVLATSASCAARAAEPIPAWVPVVSVTNGLTPDLAGARNGSLSYGVVEFAVSCDAPGVSGRSRAGWLTLQEQSFGGATARLAGALDPRLQRVRLTPDIDAHRRGKLMLNASLDPVAAVIGGLIGDVFRGRDSFRAFRALLNEALGVARAAGWRLRAVQGVHPDVMAAVFGTPLVRSFAARAAARQARSVASTLSRDIRRGELGEAEHLCGAIVREGARLGVATPAHTTAMEILRLIAAEPGGNGGRPELARRLVQC